MTPQHDLDAVKAIRKARSTFSPSVDPMSAGDGGRALAAA
jgi:hypothetical protein